MYISNENYSNEYLKTSEITDLEKYIWHFTKNWCNIYDVYDKKGKLSIQIVGETIVYDNIKCNYKNKIEDKEEAQKFYKLLKALYILATEIPHHYHFDVKINRYGALEFKCEDKKLNYDNMFQMLTNDYIKAKNKTIDLENERLNLEKEIEELKVISIQKDQEYLSKEKQIATYLECRKTFIGRVKYFFKSKRKNKNEIKEVLKEEKKEAIQKQEKLKINNKEFYTIEDVVRDNTKWCKKFNNGCKSIKK